MKRKVLHYSLLAISALVSIISLKSIITGEKFWQIYGTGGGIDYVTAALVFAMSVILTTYLANKLKIISNKIRKILNVLAIIYSLIVIILIFAIPTWDDYMSQEGHCSLLIKKQHNISGDKCY